MFQQFKNKDWIILQKIVEGDLIPEIKKGESRSDYLKRCIPYCMNNEGLDEKAAAGKCEGMYDQHQKTGANYMEELNNFVPPDSGNLPEAGKKILSKVYSECRNKWVADHPNDTENESNKTMCSQIAWTAVHNAGYKKNPKGEWGMTAYQEFTFTIDFEFIPQESQLQIITSDNTQTKEDAKWVHMKAIAIIGDRMMKEYYVPYSELKKSVDKWNNTYHDFSHLGTSYPNNVYPYSRENIEYVIGYQNNAKADDLTKQLTMDVHINKEHPKYPYWKSFIDTCKAAGRTPNVSVSLLGKPVNMKASECNCSETQNMNKDSIVQCITDIQPKALTTCMKGVCSDEKGCGLCQNHTQKEDHTLDNIEFAVWDTAYINDLPDSAFAYIEPGGSKDADGKTIPRSLRHFPYKGSDGKVDLPHLRNALARCPQSPFGPKAEGKLRAAAKEAGVGDYTENSGCCGCENCKCNSSVSGADEKKKMTVEDAEKLAYLHKRIKDLKEEKNNE